MKRKEKDRAVHRIRILKGLMDKLEESVLNDKYCIDVLSQSLAIQRALKSLDSLLLEKHLNHCVKSEMKEGKKAISLRKELLEIYKISRKET